NADGLRGKSSITRAPSERPSLLHRPVARLITPLALLVLTGALFFLLLDVPIYLAVGPAVLIHHRIGILLHEYVHGIPFRRRKHNLLMLSLFDGILLSFGMLEVFRATHLAHHRWLNTEKDPAMQGEAEVIRKNSFMRILLALEGPQHLKYLGESLRGKYPYI